MMMAPEYYVFTGRERVPRHITHVLIDNGLNFVPAQAFWQHPNIQEVICHDGVVRIEEAAFSRCPRLRRVIMPGVKFLQDDVFYDCGALTYIECGKLEIIAMVALGLCKSLRSIDLPSIKIVDRAAFLDSTNLTSVKFGKDLESFGERAFDGCTSLERITLPLKNGVITDDCIFQGCVELNRVDLAGGVHETVSALLMEEWRNDLNEEIDTISQILPNTPAGTGRIGDFGGKAQAIRTWIASVLRKIIYYKAKHRRYVIEATATLQSVLPNDIVHKNILPFLELPSYTFDGEN
jgi:hypothetical protein